tara:strand:- start:165 stop:491 length:327 start_codon:yes stop_codon:yes gene_type:complete
MQCKKCFYFQIKKLCIEKLKYFENEGFKSGKKVEDNEIKKNKIKKIHEIKSEIKKLNLKKCENDKSVYLLKIDFFLLVVFTKSKKSYAMQKMFLLSNKKLMHRKIKIF